PRAPPVAPRSGLSPPAQQCVFPEDVRALTDHPARLTRLDQALTEPGQTWRLAPGGDALPALRRGQGPGPRPTVAPRGARPPFGPPRPLLPSLGCPPSAYATGERRQPAASRSRATARPAGPCWQEPGPLATPPKSAGMGPDAWQRGPSLATLAGGRP